MAPKQKNFKKNKKITPQKKKFRKPSSGIQKSGAKKQLLTLLGAIASIGFLMLVVNAYRSGFFSLKTKEKAVVVEEQKKQEVEGINKIKIYEATWGMNCDGKVSISRFGIQDTERTVYNVEKNNVLPKLKELCETKKTCSFKVTSEFLGLEPAENCSKALILKYRCFSYDNIRELELLERSSGKISCEK